MLNRPTFQKCRSRLFRYRDVEREQILTLADEDIVSAGLISVPISFPVCRLWFLRRRSARGELLLTDYTSSLTSIGQVMAEVQSFYGTAHPVECASDSKDLRPPETWPLPKIHLGNALTSLHLASLSRVPGL